MKRAVLVLMASVLLAAPALAQDKDPVTDALKNMLKRGESNLVGAAQEMPADKYAYKATPGQMSFGQLVAHTAGSNDMLCSNIAGTTAPATKVDQNAPKDKLVQALKDSFDFCSQALSKVDDSRLSQQIPFFGGRQVSRATAMMALSNDWADHYSLAATYLRLNGMTPPSARK